MNIEQTEKNEGKNLKKYIWPCITAIYLMGSVFVWAWLLLDISFSNFQIFKLLGLTVPSNPAYIKLLKIVLYSMIGGAFGGIAFGMMNLQRHTTKDSFKVVYLGDYLFRPFGSAVLAVAVFALLRGGILTILGADPTNVKPTFSSSLSSFAIGFLSGFGSYEVVKKVNEVAKKIFSVQNGKNDIIDKEKVKSENENQMKSSKND